MEYGKIQRGMNDVAGDNVKKMRMILKGTKKLRFATVITGRMKIREELLFRRAGFNKSAMFVMEDVSYGTKEWFCY